MITPAIVCVLFGVAQTLALTPETVAHREATLLTGVVTSKIPTREGYQARGPRAEAWVENQNAIARGEDDAIPDRTGSPWLVLIGPEDATKQVASQLPEELASRVNVTRYQPDDPRLDRGLRGHYTGGTYALVLDPSRDITWQGLVDLAEILHHLRRLLGLEPDPVPPWIPSTRPRWARLRRPNDRPALLARRHPRAVRRDGLALCARSPDGASADGLAQGAGARPRADPPKLITPPSRPARSRSAGSFLLRIPVPPSASEDSTSCDRP